MERVDPGFDPRGVLVTKYVLDRRYNVDAKVDAFNQQLLSRAGGIPGVTTAALTNAVSLLGRGWSSGYTSDNGAASASDDEIAHRVVSPEYFAAMGVSLLRGRTLTEDDRRETSSLVINDVVARSLFPGQNPVGRQIGFAEPERGPGTTWYTVVGVVRAERVDALDVAPRREVYHAAAEFPAQISYLVLKTPGDPAALTPAVRAIVHDLDPNLVLRSARSMESIRMTSMARQRFLMTLLLLFAVVGVALSVVGVYGVFTHAARDRTREIGVRLALGARPSDVQWLVVRHGLRVVLGGLVVGVVAALAAAGSMRSLLYGVAPDDPVTLGVVALLLAGTALVASWLPAVKASRADPADTLRWG
jgi:predicted permease